MLDLNRLISKIDRFWIEIAIVDSIEIVGIRIVVNRQSKSMALESESSSILFVDPNRISLMPMQWARHSSSWLFITTYKGAQIVVEKTDKVG